MGLAGILVALGLLIWLAYRGWSILVLAPSAALLAAAFSGEPLLAHWTETFMGGAAHFLAQFFPLFLLGALFGKLMEDSGSVEAIARFMTEKLGSERALLAVVLAGAIVTYGGVSLFVALFVIAPMAQGLFRSAGIPQRLMPAAIALGTMTVRASRHTGAAERDCHAVFRHHAICRAGPRHHRRGHYARHRPLVAWPAGKICPASRRE
jgi:H+/gluconate symporter-like permease